MNPVQANLNMLSNEQKDMIHQHSLTILKEVGVKLDSDRAMEVMAKCDGIRIVDQQAFISEEIVDWAVDNVPESIDIYNRQGKRTFTLGGSQATTIFGIGVTNPNFHNLADNEVIPFNRSHTAIAAGLCESLPEYELLSTPGIIETESASIPFPDIQTTADMLAGTTKPLCLLVSDTAQFESVLKMVEIVTGLNAETPCIVPYFNPVTPLVINDSTVLKMEKTIQFGLPMIYSNYGMSGATAPITPAGTAALLNAELLAGLVLSQLMKAGTPVILGSLPAGFDMRTMVSVYHPMTSQLNAICAEMMAYYQVPHAGTSGSSTGWAGDIHAGGMLWMNHFSAVCGNTGLAPFVGGNFDSLVFSPELVVLSAQIIRDCREFASPIQLDSSAVAIDEMKKTGSGGNFLTSGQTLKTMPSLRKKTPRIWENISVDSWKQRDKPRAETVLREHTQTILNSLKRPKDHQEIIARSDAYIGKLMT